MRKRKRGGGANNRYIKPFSFKFKDIEYFRRKRQQRENSAHKRNSGGGVPHFRKYGNAEPKIFYKPERAYGKRGDI